jgi:hypothetical protein
MFIESKSPGTPIYSYLIYQANNTIPPHKISSFEASSSMLHRQAHKTSPSRIQHLTTLLLHAQTQSNIHEFPLQSVTMDSQGSSQLDGNIDLSKLTDKDKQELQQFIVNESQKARIQQSTSPPHYYIPISSFSFSFPPDLSIHLPRPSCKVHFYIIC